MENLALIDSFSEFKDDKFEGQATYTFKNGKIIKGIFKDGKLLR